MMCRDDGAPMYLAAIILLMLVLPAAAVAVEALLYPGAAGLMALVGKWFTFFAVGVRLLLAGASQVIRPQFTSESILGVKDPGAYVLVREVGFGNLSIGTLGLLSLAAPSFLLPAAIAGGLFIGLAGAGHAVRKNLNFKEKTALVSDLLIFVLLAAFVFWSSL
jgi:hypothetical protein